MNQLVRYAVGTATSLAPWRVDPQQRATHYGLRHSEVNDFMLEGENQVSVLEVQELFSWQEQAVQLAVPFRRLVLREELAHIVASNKRTKKRKVVRSHFFLFNDILVGMC
jgi:hypothetical protein